MTSAPAVPLDHGEAADSYPVAGVSYSRRHLVPSAGHIGSDGNGKLLPERESLITARGERRRRLFKGALHWPVDCNRHSPIRRRGPEERKAERVAGAITRQRDRGAGQMPTRAHIAPDANRRRELGRDGGAQFGARFGAGVEGERVLARDDGLGGNGARVQPARHRLARIGLERFGRGHQPQRLRGLPQRR